MSIFLPNQKYLVQFGKNKYFVQLDKNIFIYVLKVLHSVGQKYTYVSFKDVLYNWTKIQSYIF